MEQAPSTALPNAQMLMAQLEFISKLSEVVASTTELEPILDWIVRETTSLLSADEGTIHLLSSEAGVDVMHTRVRVESAGIWRTRVRVDSPGVVSQSWPRNVSLSVGGYLSLKGEALATSDLHDDDRFPSLREKPTHVRSLLAVPLKVDGRMIGMLAVMHRYAGRVWMPNEVQLLTTVANSSAGVLELARLRDEERKRKQLEDELKQARVIQMGLVPARPLRVGPWEAAGRIEPARTVGGDAFNYYPLARGRLAVAIADVSGKGVPAALLMSGVQASLRAFCDGHWAIPDAMHHLNQSVVRSAQPGKFITLFYAEVDPQANRVRYSNAGHNYPLLRHADGTVEPLKTGGLPLGLFEDTAFAEGETGFAPGDSLLLFSDGVSEALDVDRHEFGDDRLERIWREIGDRPPTEVLDRLQAELAGYRGSAEQSDDVTMVVVGTARG